jgi:hypothetical protein
MATKKKQSQVRTRKILKIPIWIVATVDDTVEDNDRFADVLAVFTGPGRAYRFCKKFNNRELLDFNADALSIPYKEAVVFERRLNDWQKDWHV